MAEIVLTTFDWVPPPPRGYVRDLRVRWALEEAGLPYRIATTPFRDRPARHLAHQPFEQVPWLTHGDITLFESGAILLYLGGLGETLMPADPSGRLAVTEWLLAALNSVEMAVLPWVLLRFSGNDRGRAWQQMGDFLHLRLKRLEPVLAGREWLAGDFSIADIMMADVLRLTDRFEALGDYPAIKAYVDRAIVRPAFVKAHADQLAHFGAAD